MHIRFLPLTCPNDPIPLPFLEKSTPPKELPPSFMCSVRIGSAWNLILALTKNIGLAMKKLVGLSLQNAIISMNSVGTNCTFSPICSVKYFPNGLQFFSAASIPLKASTAIFTSAKQGQVKQTTNAQTDKDVSVRLRFMIGLRKFMSG